MNRPLDATEWLEALRIGPDTVAADFACELLGRVDRTDDLEAYDSLVEDLAKVAGQTFDEPWRMVEFFTDRHHLLVEIEQTLAEFKLVDAFSDANPEDTADAVKRLLGELDELRERADGLEYELQHCGSETP